MQAVIEDEEAIQKIMSQYDKQNETKEEYITDREKRIRKLCQVAEVNYDDYVKAISTSKSGYSVVLQRDLDELCINPYNIEWLRAWDGNMDIQIQTCKKSGTWEPSSRTFLEENPDIFQKSKIFKDILSKFCSNNEIIRLK